VILNDLLNHVLAALTASLATPSGRLALVAAGVATALIVAGSLVKTMVPLRWLTVGSNVGFLCYGILHPSLPMLLLQALLLPINLYRAIEMMGLQRRVRAASAKRDMSGLWLRPYMKRRRMAAGEVLFRKGDPASQLYMLASGRIELVEIGTMLEPGRIFGEIAFFSPDQRRTLTARCLEPCELLTIEEATVHQLYFQSPEFGFEMINLLAGRLMADVERLRRTVDTLSAAAAPAVASSDAAPGGAAR
jgi:CRP/FNR family transcriptional regulator, cyclic AMP receptor protein